MFELSQLRCFVAAAEELHFGRAAQRLNMTQSPLSRQIQLLERILGVTLLERTSRQVSLTPAGHVFLIEARRIVRLAESASLSARRVAQGDAGKVAIGFTAVSGYGLVPHIVANARASLPNIDLDLHEMVSGDQVDALLTGLIDIGFVRPPVDRHEFETLCVLHEPLVVALPPGDPRQSKPSFELADFDDAPLIMYARQGAGYFHNMLVRLFDDAGVSPLYVQHVTQIHSMLGLVHAGLAAALVPQSASGLHLMDVQFRALRTDPENPVELHMAWRRDNANPALEPMRRLCAQTAGA
ncbi:LysR family transcriptional regulator [Sphingomonas kyeonggiensis]|uniref:DNA-binding transcriptional LysR family regulator n=1 Tax=Sphingomonas kyeonggiensis TaxID=1268553 RepID=A0A7W6JXM9_9SPHN|nr:LysR family transcriptional regulator [Sphingomonas kyeonggiensis]MBB4101336.1 DNA-binding transcriptional LysR family regulator [Sphingomonas kyeonggiensis]